MAKYKIVYSRKDCIGVFACVSMSEKYWEIGEDNKANLKGAKLNKETGFFELEIPEEDYAEVLDSATVCPVEVIMIDKIEDSGEIKRVYPEASS